MRWSWRVRLKPVAAAAFALGLLLLIAMWVLTWLAMEPLPALDSVVANSELRLQDRMGRSLADTAVNDWNSELVVALAEVPPLLRSAFLMAEDRRFYSHHGVDWRARLAALMQNLRRGFAYRGASTITEQVVRQLHPRSRTLWHKWLEGWEAAALERSASKDEIFAFYLNQLPYASQRRGVASAARFYFDRDLDTLSLREMLTLVALVRAPDAYDLNKPASSHPALQRAVVLLAQELIKRGLLAPEQWRANMEAPLVLVPESKPVPAWHFTRHLRRLFEGQRGIVRTTLDLSLQQRVQKLVDARLRGLSDHDVNNAAVLVIDHGSAEVLAWVVGGAADLANGVASAGSFYDAVTVPRQPGSTLKPFVYAMALEKGWTAATTLRDAPLQLAVGHGLHQFRNYSRQYYGEVSVREALANSLNIPAVETLRMVGVEPFWQRLHDLGMKNLTRAPEYYGDGLVLGNGEISLYELVQAYTALANRGRWRPLRVQRDQAEPEAREVFSAEVSSLISNILADNEARQLEFGAGNTLFYHRQTAIKTGTSNDHRDAWTLAYNDRYLIGVWMGNLDRRPMRDVSGATGPALLVRSIFNELGRDREAQPLWLSPRLQRRSICVNRESGDCLRHDEWFVETQDPVADSVAVSIPVVRRQSAPLGEMQVSFSQPTDQLELALDPRLPDTAESFTFRLDGIVGNTSVRWYLDNQLLATTASPEYRWALQRGAFALRADWLDPAGDWRPLAPVRFRVK